MEKFIDITNKEEAKEMFLANKDTIYRFILVKTNDTHLSEDLLSETFVKFFRYGLKNKIERKRVKNLLFTIAANNITDYFRRKKKVSFVSLDKKENQHSTFLAEAAIDKTTMIQTNMESEIQIKIQTINDIAKNLPKKQQEAFYLRFTQNLNFSQIAEIQKTSIATALSRVRYGINKIKNSLNKRGLRNEI